ncbi:MAG: hypothetical protein ACKVY0_01460 [Prosthecobacter sp.]|uniref:hypothetical protein n=1 Tax=Prosthecobacter sp. TaxID=1965333 RepID=UPI0038FEFF81
MSEAPPHPPTPATEQPQPVCDRCGKPEVTKFGDEFICDDCYIACGSCCAGEDA